MSRGHRLLPPRASCDTGTLCDTQKALETQGTSEDSQLGTKVAQSWQLTGVHLTVIMGAPSPPPALLLWKQIHLNGNPSKDRVKRAPWVSVVVILPVLISFVFKWLMIKFCTDDKVLNKPS